MVRLATVHFDAFPIWLSEQEGFSERGRPTVFCRRGLVVHGNPSAVRAGISAGMSLQGALQQAAELQQVPLSVLSTFFPCHFAPKGGGHGTNSNEGWKRWQARCGERVS
ncbi:MAG: hypothetical protein OXC09_12770 [Truepera sp.]|nr:hypothetical protein [Truepera sp.]